ncbi:hypothetical protein [Thermohalobacter berrensis]|uniref:Uncharacterized protein n=1 Tax=Thermohalobacter berrensis TaxID=99594 RepID=A0A419T1V0_9FIRM|nr:hypothetical protein [Thermohalobacter berrensis]RKD31457.1 hypothetical protein BET03_12635 [Thermohalobacter berrensis]
MELVCPLCNNLEEYTMECPMCKENMMDEGPIVNYLDDYSPYLPKDITQLVDGAEHDKCVHLFRCKGCNYDKRVEIKRIKI